MSLVKKNDGGSTKESKSKSLDELVKEYKLNENLSRFVVSSDSRLKEKL